MSKHKLNVLFLALSKKWYFCVYVSVCMWNWWLMCFLFHRLFCLSFLFLSFLWISLFFSVFLVCLFDFLLIWITPIHLKFVYLFSSVFLHKFRFYDYIFFCICICFICLTFIFFYLFVTIQLIFSSIHLQPSFYLSFLVVII